jgi:hypothetical protein
MGWQKPVATSEMIVIHIFFIDGVVSDIMPKTH